ncbi:MAG: hypothetical protein EOP82_09740 [Variovorax sp.]|nr:MAG: hypothetical protein EOP82_09740 [Variovorax sp.]
MKRDAIRLLKKTLRAGGDAQASPQQAQEARTAALALLERSVAMKHDRLAIQRLLDAVRLEAPVEPALWAHCEAAAARLPGPVRPQMLQLLRHQSAQRASHGSHVADR